MAKQQFYVPDDNDAPALIRAYGYLIRQDCRWLANLPGIDNKRLKQARQAQVAGDLWRVDDLIDAARKLPRAFPTTAPAQSRAAA